MFRCPYSYSHINSDSPSTSFPSTSQSVTLCLSITISLTVPCILTSPYFLSLHFSFPHSSLAWIPRQMVHASRCSPPSLSEGKTKAGSKANKICWRVPKETNREVHGTINPGSVQGQAFYWQVESMCTGGQRKKSTKGQRLLSGSHHNAKERIWHHSSWYAIETIWCARSDCLRSQTVQLLNLSIE